VAPAHRLAVQYYKVVEVEHCDDSSSLSDMMREAKIELVLFADMKSREPEWFFDDRTLIEAGEKGWSATRWSFDRKGRRPYSKLALIVKKQLQIVRTLPLSESVRAQMLCRER
jgi:hypothetical protein